MEQRPLRLGDIVDDYCPRERRVTNHVIVALVDDGIRQTRCGTCDTEHVYKAARLPRRRLKDDQPDNGAGQLVSRATAEPIPALPVTAAPEPIPAPRAADAPNRASAIETPAAAPAASDDATADRPDDGWPAHRRLIRATLPRVEGEQKEPRPIPEFTMHQRQGRGGGMYRGDHFANGNGNGNGNGGGGFRHGQPGGGGGGPRRDHGGGGQPGAGGPGGAGGGGGKRWRHRRRGRGGPPKPTN